MCDVGGLWGGDIITIYILSVCVTSHSVVYVCQTARLLLQSVYVYGGGGTADGIEVGPYTIQNGMFSLWFVLLKKDSLTVILLRA